MKVFIVMGNDYPDAVFTRADDAQSYCNRMRPNNRRIYWKVYPFELDAAGMTETAKRNANFSTSKPANI